MRNQLDIWRGDRNFITLQRAMNRLFEDFLEPWDNNTGEFPSSLYDFAPSGDVEEYDDNFVYSFDVPGVNKEDIKVEVSNGNLVISGERKEEHRNRSRSGRTYERQYGQFQRVISLPQSVKANQIEAAYENGVLRVAIPKTEETKAASIPISEGKTGIFQRLGTKAKEKLGSLKTTEASKH